MPPTLALILWLFLLLALFRFDPAKDPDASLALWVPLFWMFIIGSRLPSQWLGFTGGIAAQTLEEGNPLDRSVFFLLIVLAAFILTMRAFNWGAFLSHNFCLFVFLSFALISVVWSDYPLIAFKRWFRDLGNYFVILVVLSDPSPLEAVRTLLRRFCYLLIPLSIMLVKYYPGMSIQYGQWSGVAEISGAATSKNMLGAICLVSGIFFFWDTITRWSDRKEQRTKWIIRLNVAFLLMTLRLLSLSRSATSQVCLVIGCIVIVAFQSNWGNRHPLLLKTLIPASFCLYIILAFGFDLSGQFANQVGRDATLTDRTVIWKAVLNEHTNPLIGTGYESFWLGARLERIWQAAGYINEAHNGYLDIYLNLGGIGVLLLGALLIACYRTICKTSASTFRLAPFNLAMFTVILFYNITEAGFKGGVLWLILLLAGIAIPERAKAPVRRGAAGNNVGNTKRLPGPLLEAPSQRR
jgi:exopolysaccharide production protein ExoQ